MNGGPAALTEGSLLKDVQGDDGQDRLSYIPWPVAKWLRIVTAPTPYLHGEYLQD